MILEEFGFKLLHINEPKIQFAEGRSAKAAGMIVMHVVRLLAISCKYLPTVEYNMNTISQKGKPTDSFIYYYSQFQYARRLGISKKH
jgi:hypothetical protein